MEAFLEKLEISKGNTLVITYANEIDKNTYNCKIPIDISIQIIPLITSLLQKRSVSKKVSQLYHTNSYIETVKYNATKSRIGIENQIIGKHLTHTLVDHNYDIDTSILIKFNNKISLPYIRFPSCKNYYYQSDFYRIEWKIDSDISVQLDINQDKKFSTLQIICNISEEKELVKNKKKEILRIYNIFSKIIAVSFSS
jgi:hypothetical protein